MNRFLLSIFIVLAAYATISHQKPYQKYNESTKRSECTCPPNDATTMPPAVKTTTGTPDIKTTVSKSKSVEQQPSKKNKRLCRTKKNGDGKRECLCGEKWIYDPAEEVCHNGNVFSRNRPVGQPQQGPVGKPKPTFDDTKSRGGGTGAANDALTAIAVSLGEALAELIERHGGNSHKTFLEIVNDSDEKFTIKVSEVDNHDWDGDSRPDHQFQNATIDPHSSIKHQQEINAKSLTAMSTMTFHVGDEAKFTMRVDQWNAKAKTETPKDFDLANDYSAHLTAGIGGDTQKITIKKK